MSKSSIVMLTSELTKTANKRNKLIKKVDELKKRIEEEDLNIVRIFEAISGYFR